GRRGSVGRRLVVLCSGSDAAICGGRLLSKYQFVALAIYDARLSIFYFPSQQRFRERIFQIVLDCTTQRTCAVLLIVAFLDEELLRLRRELQRDLPLGEALREVRQ